MHVKPLVVCPWPMTLPEVAVEMKKIKADKAFALNMKQPEAYGYLRDFFLSQKEYTHMVICPYDLIVAPVVFEILRWDVQQSRGHVFCGMCNISDTDDRMCIAKKVNSHKFMTYDEAMGEACDCLNHGLIKVEEEGFACTWIDRQTVERFEFHSLAGQDGGSFNEGFDTDCAKAGIPIYCDTLAIMKHIPAHNQGIPWFTGTSAFKFERYIEDASTNVDQQDNTDSTSGNNG